MAVKDRPVEQWINAVADKPYVDQLKWLMRAMEYAEATLGWMGACHTGAW